MIKKFESYIKESINIDENLEIDGSEITMMFDDGYHIIGFAGGDRDDPSIGFLLEMEDGVWWQHTHSKKGFLEGLENTMKWNSIWENLLLTYPNSEISTDESDLMIHIPISDFGRKYRDDLIEYWNKHEL